MPVYRSALNTAMPGPVTRDRDEKKWLFQYKNNLLYRFLVLSFNAADSVGAGRHE
jgi:hypothetical protein